MLSLRVFFPLTPTPSPLGRGGSKRAAIEFISYDHKILIISLFPNIYLPTIITLASAEAKSGLGVADHPGQQRCSRYQPRL